MPSCSDYIRKCQSWDFVGDSVGESFDGTRRIEAVQSHVMHIRVKLMLDLRMSLCSDKIWKRGIAN